MGNPPLLIRADASVQMGTGHAMRCLALAQAWQEAAGTARFVLGSATTAIEARLNGEGMAFSQITAPSGSALDAMQTIAMAREVGAAWVVVDGYQFDADYQRAIKESGMRLLFVDDYGHAQHYWADLILNQNIYASEALYPGREADARLLLGTRYALLRREFWPWRGWQRQMPEVARRVLVTLGGADPANVTLKVVEALAKVTVDGLEAKIVVGGSNPHRETLQRALTREISPTYHPQTQQLRLVENTANMPELMAWADLAVSAAGTTSWELAFMQVPSLVLSLAENQRHNAEGLDAAGAAKNLGWHSELSADGLAGALAWLSVASDTRSTMAERGRMLVDCQGGQRVAELLATMQVHVRPAVAEDRELLFQWANDPLTRQMSLRTEPIRWEEHQRWFDRVINEPAILMLIAELWDSGRWAPIGQLRIDSEGVVSIALAPGYRGKRLALPVLQAAVAVHKAHFPGKVLTAYIKPENQPSQRAFSRAGFETMGWAEVLGQWLLKYVLW